MESWKCFAAVSAVAAVVAADLSYRSHLNNFHHYWSSSNSISGKTKLTAAGSDEEMRKNDEEKKLKWKERKWEGEKD